MGIVCRDNRATLRFAARLGLPLDGCYQVFGSRDDAEIDFDKPLSPRPVEGWPAWARRYRSSFLTGAFGERPFGFGDGGPGLAVGPFWMGPFGRGTFSLSVTLAKLADGDWRITVVACDASGNFLSDPGELQFVEKTVAGTPAPPTDVSADDYDPETDTLTLTWTPSTDDEG